MSHKMLAWGPSGVRRGGSYQLCHNVTQCICHTSACQCWHCAHLDVLTLGLSSEIHGWWLCLMLWSAQNSDACQHVLKWVIISNISEKCRSRNLVFSTKCSLPGGFRVVMKLFLHCFPQSGSRCCFLMVSPKQAVLLCSLLSTRQATTSSFFGAAKSEHTEPVVGSLCRGWQRAVPQALP